MSFPFSCSPKLCFHITLDIWSGSIFNSMLIELRTFTSVLSWLERRENKIIEYLFLNHILLNWQKETRCCYYFWIFQYLGENGGEWFISLFLPCYLNFSFSIDFLARYWVFIYPGFLGHFLTFPIVALPKTTFVIAINFLYFTEVLCK